MLVLQNRIEKRVYLFLARACAGGAVALGRVKIRSKGIKGVGEVWGGSKRNEREYGVGCGGTNGIKESAGKCFGRVKWKKRGWVVRMFAVGRIEKMRGWKTLALGQSGMREYRG